MLACVAEGCPPMCLHTGGADCVTGRSEHHTQQNGGAQASEGEDLAPNDTDNVSTGTEGATEDDHADSPTRPHGAQQHSLPMADDGAHDTATPDLSAESKEHLRNTLPLDAR